jgi:hypothetical protein
MEGTTRTGTQTIVLQLGVDTREFGNNIGGSCK